MGGGAARPARPRGSCLTTIRARGYVGHASPRALIRARGYVSPKVARGALMELYLGKSVDIAHSDAWGG